MSMRKLKHRGLIGCGCVLAAIGLFSSGCEWKSSGSDNSWSDSVSWANFTGIYRSGDNSRALVGNFSLSSGGTATEEESSSSDYVEYPVADQAGPTIASFFTEASDSIAYMNRGNNGWSLKPGSIQIRFEGTTTGPVGAFTDNGSGVLEGTYEQVSGGATFAATGTIDYDTGAWSVTLDGSSPFLEAADVTYSYVVLEDTSAEEGSAQDEDEDPPTSHGWVYSLEVQQTGNRLRMVDNRGFVWEGRIISMTTPGGDTSGRSSGTVVGSFEVTGVTDSSYTITGTFSGTYTVSADEDVGGLFGQLTGRIIQGIWMEPTGNGDLYGETTDGSQTEVSSGADDTQ
jgi:hypothetical protein